VNRTILTKIVLCAGILPMTCLGQGTLAGPVNPPAQPVTAAERLKWFTTSTVGPQSLAGGVVSAAWGTMYNSPREYGPHWEGFGDRYGMRLTGISTGNAMEAGLGALWHEDPRYNRVENEGFGRRVRHIVVMTFMAPNGRGGLMPAYARYAAISGNNFLSNTWREPSEATNDRALFRTGTGFLGRMAGNAFQEFWPDVTKKFKHR
jgi:hypothetical protein